ncbi:hypothetical protein HK096_002250 [Nowakowskiella sp. JEL0078]|nr:hypothetical protein HK096_002250 [Nowakowskiella sp. JEL0078]
MESEYRSLGFFSVSPNHKLVAYGVDTTGDEIYTVFVKDLESGVILEKIDNIGDELEWANDSMTIFFTLLDEIHRPYKIRKHVLGTSPISDVILFEELDEKFRVSIGKTNSDKYLIVDISSSLTSEIWYLDAEKPFENFKVFNPREYRHQYSVEHQGNRFVVLSDNGGQYLNFRLCWCPLDATSKDNWKEIIPYNPLVSITRFESFESHLVIVERVNGLANIRVLGSNSNGDIDGNGDDYNLSFPEEIYVVSPRSDYQAYNSTVLRYTYTSPLTPRQIWDYDLSTRSGTLLKETPIPIAANFDKSKYAMARIFADIPENTKVEAPFNTPVSGKIPISIVYNKDGFKRDGENKLYLTGYGSYGITYEPSFDSKIFSALDRGYVYAIAHIRGGGENGRSWYETGKFLHKQNTFTDFIAAGDELVKLKFTKHEKMCIQGASAGGLLIGAVLNLRPNLCNVALAGVPFVDVINTMMDASIPLTVGEYEEWGNPNEEKYFDYMLSYSPYDNVKKGAKFPHLFIKAGLFDPRVAYWEPAKWVAKLRQNVAENGKVLVLKTKMGSGHFGASGRYAYLKEYADEYAFFLHFNN